MSQKDLEGNVGAPEDSKVKEVYVEEGKKVTKGQALMKLNSFGKDIIIESPVDGTVSKLEVTSETNVIKDELLVDIFPK